MAKSWRTRLRGLTLEQLATRIGVTHASPSRIERGLQPYSQPLLEALADTRQDQRLPAEVSAGEEATHGPQAVPEDTQSDFH